MHFYNMAWLDFYGSHCNVSATQFQTKYQLLCIKLFQSFNHVDSEGELKR